VAARGACGLNRIAAEFGSASLILIDFAALHLVDDGYLPLNDVSDDTVNLQLSLRNTHISCVHDLLIMIDETNC
jgi:hypothetical protein